MLCELLAFIISYCNKWKLLVQRIKMPKLVLHDTGEFEIAWLVQWRNNIQGLSWDFPEKSVREMRNLGLTLVESDIQTAM